MRGHGQRDFGGLPHLHQALIASGHPSGLAVTVIDGDRISAANCVRQPFSASEIGYVQPWYHGIENLRKDHRGYVYWKGVQVDHFSFDKYEEAHEAAIELADRCRTLEMLGLPVSTAHQAWWYDELVSAVTAN